MVRKGLAILWCLVLFSGAFFSCSGKSDGKVTLQVGHVLTADSHYGMGLKEFARLVELYSHGTVTLEIFPDSLLGNERDLIESVSLGTVAMTLISSAPMTNFFPDFAVLDLPYLFPTAEIAYHVLDGEVGTYLLNQLPAQGIIGLGFWDNGFRHVTNNIREIKTPEDLAGLKIRTMENEIHMDTYREYGSSPLPMAFGELFIALQQGVIDGQETPAFLIYTSKFHEVQKYMSLTGNLYAAAPLLINRAIFERLTQEQQDAIWRAAAEATNWQRNFSQEMEQVAIERIRDSGTIVTEVDRDVWIKASQGTYRNYEGTLNQDLIQRIVAITEALQ